MSLPYHAKGYRFLRVGETVQAGDFMPDGIDWEPVSDGLIGTEVFGSRWSGGEEGELFCRPRKRALHEWRRNREIQSRRPISTSVVY